MISKSSWLETGRDFLLKLLGGLTAQDVRIGLVDFGLFSEKLPPCFSSEGLWEKSRSSFTPLAGLDEEASKELIQDMSHDNIRYEAMRETNVARSMGIPHPESNILLAQAIFINWKKIKKHCDLPTQKISRIYVRYIDGSKIFEMNYKGDERWNNEEEELRWQAGARYRVSADISTCFPSIYTHSLPWALHGKKESKHDQKLKSLYGNLLDACSRANRDKQTNGLLIGPHASNILSETILTQVDVNLINKGYSKFFRHIDDYQFYASDRDEAERFIRDLGLALRDYELSLNERKTQITELPTASQESWVSVIQRFRFTQGENIIRWGDVQNFLNLALELAEQHGKSTPINYALKSVPINLNERAKRLFTLRCMELALARPYLAPVLIKDIFPRYEYSGKSADIQIFASNLVTVGIERLYPDAVAHALYLAIKENQQFDLLDDPMLRILELNDCVCNLLLYEYGILFKRTKLQRKVKKIALELKTEPGRDQDRNWLLIYHLWTESELRGAGQNYLADLKKKNFSFIKFN